MKVRLLIMIVIFAIAAGGIMGYRYYITSDIPEGDPSSKPEIKENDPMANPGIEGAGAIAPPA